MGCVSLPLPCALYHPSLPLSVSLSMSLGLGIGAWLVPTSLFLGFRRARLTPFITTLTNSSRAQRGRLIRYANDQETC